MKTVALIEFNWRGHNPGYYRMFCRALLDMGCRVAAFCPQPEQVRQWNPEQTAAGQLDAEKLTDEVQRRRWIRKVPQLAGVFRFKQHARQLAHWEAKTGCRIDLVFFACLYDGVSPLGGMDAIFPWRWTALLIDSSCVRVPNGPGRWLRHRAFDPLALYRARGCVSLASLDQFICDELSRRTSKPVPWLPESIEMTTPRANFPLAESIRTQAAGRPVVGCFGQFARRKGALSFLRLAEACREESWFFTWAGAFEEDSFSASELRWIKAFLASPPENCRIELGRVADEADFDALVELSTVLYLCYHRHPGSSNVLSKAVTFDKLVLVSDGFCMADQTRRYDLGLCVPEGDIFAAREALGRLLTPGNDLPVARFAEYRANHAPSCFARAVAQMVAPL